MGAASVGEIVRRLELLDKVDLSSLSDERRFEVERARGLLVKAGKDFEAGTGFDGAWAHYRVGVADGVLWRGEGPSVSNVEVGCLVLRGWMSCRWTRCVFL